MPTGLLARRLLAASFVSSYFGAATLVAQMPSVVPLQFPPAAYGSYGGQIVSDDGTTVVGGLRFENSSGTQPVFPIRWDEAGQPEVLDSLAPRDDGYQVVYPRALSADGSVAVGQSTLYDGDEPLGTRAVRWDADGNVVMLDPLSMRADGYASSYAEAVSDDGTIAVGFAQKYLPDGSTWSDAAVRWNADGTVEELEPLSQRSDGRTEAYVQDVSADGSVVVGHAYLYDADGTFLGQRPVRWNAAGEVEELPLIGAPASGSAYGYAYAVSDDGDFVSGQAFAYGADGTFVGARAVRWNAAGDVEDVGPHLRGNYHFREYGLFISGDGAVVAGWSDPYLATDDGWERAFVWSSDAGAMLLPTFASDSQGGYFGESQGRALSGDGRTFVGYAESTGDATQEAFVWRDGTFSKLEDAIESYGIDLQADGWDVFYDASDCSDDGTVIVGYGTRNGEYTPFRLTLPHNEPPVLAGDVAEGETVEATVGFEYEASLVADDPEGHDLTLSVEGLPPGASISPAPGTTLAAPFDVTIAWTPDPTDIHSSHLITLTVQDQIGASASLSFELTVPPNERPTVAAIDPVTAECDGNGASVELRTTVDDPDGHVLTVTWSVDGVVERTDFDVAAGTTTNFARRFDDGSYVVTVEADDGIDVATTSTRVSVSDSTSPVLVVASDVVVATDPGKDYASGVELDEPTVTDLCDGDPLVLHDAPTVFPLGETNVNWTAIDADGNVGTGTQRVIVEDQEAPEILVDDVTDNVDRGEVFATIRLREPYAFDNATENVDLENDAPEVFPIGLTIVTWTATDDAGNQATARQRVRVTQERPTADAGTDLTVVAKSDKGVRVRLDGRRSSDPDKHDLKFLWSAKGVEFEDASSPNPVALFPPGATRVGLMVTDEAGTTDKASVVVRVKVEKPERPKKRRVAADRPRAGQIAAYVNESRLLCEQLAGTDPNNGYFAYAAYYVELADRYDAAAWRVKTTSDPPRPGDLRRYFAMRELQAQCSFYAAQCVYAGYWHSPGVHSFYESFVAAYVASANAGYSGQADLE